MKCLINNLPFLLFLLLLACTNNKALPEFQWRGLANPGVTKVKVETKKSIDSASEAMVGRTESGLEVLGIEHKLGPKSFDEIFSKMKFLLDSIYQDQNAPYPGQITKIISCPEQFRPRPLPEKSDALTSRKGFLLMANSREVFGACDVGSAQYQAAYLLIGCRGENIAYEIKLFIPAGAGRAEELEGIYGHFVCRKKN
jgi:hypothetical protein